MVHLDEEIRKRIEDILKETFLSSKIGLTVPEIEEKVHDTIPKATKYRIRALINQGIGKGIIGREKIGGRIIHFRRDLMMKAINLLKKESSD